MAVDLDSRMDLSSGERITMVLKRAWAGVLDVNFRVSFTALEDGLWIDISALGGACGGKIKVGGWT